MKMQPLIRLWETVGLGLIVELPTGVVYGNQTGGTNCLQSSAEGTFLPLGHEDAESILLAYFEGPKHGGAGATSGLDAEDADSIEAVLAKARLSEVIRVDRARLSESHEAWVRVELLGDDTLQPPLYQGLGPYPRSAVLTWSNSD